MIVASFYQGPFDGRKLVLPTNKPWPRFVIPKFDNPIQIEFFYLYSGWVDDMATYLFDDSYGGIIPDVTAP